MPSPMRDNRTWRSTRSGGVMVAATWTSSASDTSRCWAPSCRSRSIRRLVSSASATSLARGLPPRPALVDATSEARCSRWCSWPGFQNGLRPRVEVVHDGLSADCDGWAGKRGAAGAAPGLHGRGSRPLTTPANSPAHARGSGARGDCQSTTAANFRTEPPLFPRPGCPGTGVDDPSETRTGPTTNCPRAGNPSPGRQLLNRRNCGAMTSVHQHERTLHDHHQEDRPKW